jgi:protein-tyrosine-phosphatase
MNILFVCRYNRFRSKIAEALFRKLNKDKKIKVKSAGVIKGNKISSAIKRSVKEFGIRIDSEPEGLSSELLCWQDLIVVVADDVPLELFKGKEGKRVKVWKIKDTSEGNLDSMKKIIIKIQDKVKLLIKELGSD